MPTQAQRGDGGTAPTHSQPVIMWVVSTTLRPLYPRGRHGIHCTRGFVRLMAGLDSTENLDATVI
jgi:hypothetical protein